ncbi:MAG: CPBP family glutamic-type intramembrane protease, partial [Acidobacteriota bacterium]
RGCLPGLEQRRRQRRGVAVVGAKLALVLAVGLFIALVQVLQLWLFAGLGLFGDAESFGLSLSAGSWVWLVVLIVPLAALISAVLLLLSARAGSYKEFQIVFFPLLLVCAALASVAVLPAASLRSIVVLLPISNVAVGLRETMSGRLDVPFLLAAVGVSFAWAGLAAWGVLRALTSERLVTSADAERADLVGGRGLFERHVLRWFAAMWAIVLLSSANLPFLGELRAQVLFNLGVVFAGASFLMIKVYRLDVRQALSLRAPHPAVWPAVVLAAPAGLIVALLSSQLGSGLFPIPQEMAEAFSRALLPEDLSLVELLFWIAVMPAVCEEIAFRGVLMHGLRRKLSPLALCLATAVVFALFHFELFRLLPTMTIGLMLAGVTWLSGSIYPAVVWHGLNNGLAVVAEKREIRLDEVEPWVSAASVAVLVGCFAWFWRFRRPREHAPGRDDSTAARESGDEVPAA